MGSVIIVLYRKGRDQRPREFTLLTQGPKSSEGKSGLKQADSRAHTLHLFSAAHPFWTFDLDIVLLKICQLRAVASTTHEMSETYKMQQLILS